MSWHRAIWLSCNRCGVRDTHDHPRHTVDAARAAARRLHWTCTGGEDLCPVCSALRDPARRDALLAAARAKLPAGDPEDLTIRDPMDESELAELALLAGWL